MSGGSSDKVGKRNGRLLSLQALLETLNAFNSTRFAPPIRRQAGGGDFRADSSPSFRNLKPTSSFSAHLDHLLYIISAYTLHNE